MAHVGRTASGSAGGEWPAEYAHCIERTRRSLQGRLSQAPAGDVIREYFERGKMLRAYLVFAASASVGGLVEDVVVAAEAIELLHGASLFHDDIIDDAAERRGMAALHQRLGIGPALVVGDDLLLRALAVLNEARACHGASRVLEASDALNELARECCRGQFDELRSGRWISEADYLAIVTRKTAAAFVAAGTLGVLLGGGTEAHLAHIQVYARHLGIAFQIADDLLDLIGESGLLGKPVGNSLAQGRPMLPLIYLWQVSSEPERLARSRLGGAGRPRDGLVSLVGLLEQHGIIDRVRQVQRRYIDAAVGALAGLPDAGGVEALRVLAMRATAAPLGVNQRAR